MKKILITGAGGNIGSALQSELIDRQLTPIAGLRSNNAGVGQNRSVESCQCNFESSGELGAAMSRANGLFLLLPFHERMIEWGIRSIAEAQRNGVDFVVKLSGLGAAPDCESRIGALHGQIDQVLKDSGITYCILRCNSFMQNFSGLYRPMITRRRVISLPEGDARMCFVDTVDIAAVAARIFSEPETHANKSYDLSGATPISNSDAAEIISAFSDQPVSYRAISDQQAADAYSKLGISQWKIDALASLSLYLRAGYAATPSNTINEILGRAPIEFREFASRHRHCWI